LEAGAAGQSPAPVTPVASIHFVDDDAAGRVESAPLTAVKGTQIDPRKRSST
jgi:hypothetical protein